MKFLIQRVSKADVKVDDKIIGQIGKGFLVFVGISDSDDKSVADKMIKKLIGLRLFKDENGKVNVDEEPELSSIFRVESIPTLVVLDHGKAIKSSVGYVTKEKVLELLGL